VVKAASAADTRGGCG